MNSDSFWPKIKRVNKNNNKDKNLHRYTADGGKNKDNYRWEFLKTMLQSRLQNML